MAGRAAEFRALHRGGVILVLPNAWDVASARLMWKAGFPALGTTSAGIAFSLGYPDGEHVSRAEMLDAVGRIVRAVDVPVSADVEAGYGPRLEDVAATVRGVLEAGAVGINLEDGTGRRDAPLRPLADAALRVSAARRAARDSGSDLFINARSDGYGSGGSGAEVFRDTVRRANAYLEAGADGVFVPFVSDAPTIGRLVREIAGPLNVLSTPTSPAAAELQSLGVARVSVGSAIVRACYGLARDALEELRDGGTIARTARAIPYPQMNDLLGREGGSQ